MKEEEELALVLTNEVAKWWFWFNARRRGH
jgi:hypothetical protein